MFSSCIFNGELQDRNESFLDTFFGSSVVVVLTGSGAAPTAGGDPSEDLPDLGGRAEPEQLGWPAGKPWLRVPATLQPAPSLRGRPLLAFCGIGLPGKFFAALRHGQGIDPIVAAIREMAGLAVPAE